MCSSFPKTCISQDGQVALYRYARKSGNRLHITFSTVRRQKRDRPACYCNLTSESYCRAKGGETS